MIATDEGNLVLRWLVNGRDALLVPPFAGVGRSDGLWKTTCFELFVADADGCAYREYNFSPSQRWAAYRFDSYREGMRQLELAHEPLIRPEEGDQLFVLTVTLDGGTLAGAGAAGLAAVIEERCGRKSFWALAHGRDVPDFHDPACFALPVG